MFLKHAAALTFEHFCNFFLGAAPNSTHAYLKASENVTFLSKLEDGETE